MKSKLINIIIIPCFLIFFVSCTNEKAVNQIVDKNGDPIEDASIVVLSDSDQQHNILFSNQYGIFNFNNLKLKSDTSKFVLLAEGYVPYYNPSFVVSKMKKELDNLQSKPDKKGVEINFIIKDCKGCPENFKDFIAIKILNYPYSQEFIYLEDSIYKIIVYSNWFDSVLENNGNIYIISEIPCCMYQLHTLDSQSFSPIKDDINGKGENDIGLVIADTPVKECYIEINFESNRIDYPNRTWVEIDKNFSFYKNKNDTSKTPGGSIEIHDSDNFDKKIFINECNFSGSINSKISFKNAIFLKKVTFNNVNFNDSVDFSKSQFFSSLTFDQVTFKKNANFECVDFAKELILNDIKFNSVSFTYSQMPLSIKIFEVSIEEDAEMLNILSNRVFGQSKFTIYNSDCQKIKLIFNEDNFMLQPIYNKNLNVLADFNSYYNRIQNLNLAHDLMLSTYQKLVDKAKFEGYKASYEFLDKEYKKFYYHNCEENYTWSVFINWLQKNWWGYGYDKELIIRNTLIIFLFFVIINIFVLKKLARDVYKDNNIIETLNSEGVMPIVIFLKRIPMSVFYTSIIFFVVSINLDRLKYKENLKGKRFLWLVYFGLIYVSGLVCIGYLANFILSNGA